MSAPNFVHQWLLKRLLLLDGRSGHYVLRVWDNDTQNYKTIGGGSGGGSPLLRPGGLQHAVELVVLAGDPPDAVSLAGEFVYLRRMQPDFTLSPTGDLTVVEGA